MKNLVIVTGSSRGIGEAIALEFSNYFKSDTHILLIARDISKLNQVKSEILSTSNNQVSVLNMDFSAEYTMNDYFKLLKEVFTDEYLAGFENLYAIYNHGTLEFGSISLVAQSNSLQEKFEINLFSIWNLLAAINLLIPTSVIPKQFHVNISSGYANEPTQNWSAHCSVRCARDMLFKCYALEQADIKVLNYEPGIVYTDMLRQACEISEEYKEGYNSGKYTKPEETACKLISILIQNNFTSGSKLKYSS